MDIMLSSMEPNINLMNYLLCWMDGRRQLSWQTTLKILWITVSIISNRWNCVSLDHLTKKGTNWLYISMLGWTVTWSYWWPEEVNGGPRGRQLEKASVNRWSNEREYQHKGEPSSTWNISSFILLPLLWTPLRFHSTIQCMSYHSWKITSKTKSTRSLCLRCIHA